MDDSLLYCLDDGTPLVQGSVADEPATAILPGESIRSEAGTQVFDAQKTDGSIGSRLTKYLPWLAAGVFAMVSLVLLALFLKTGSNSAETRRLSFAAPPDLSFNDVQPDWAVISPDGLKVAFNAISEDGKNRLYVRELNSAEAKLLPASDNPIEPFWSPDSKSIAYGSNGKLKRSELSGGNPQVLCDAARVVAGTWSKNGVIVFVPDYRRTVMQVSAQGGEPRAALAVEFDTAEERHRYPYFLPDGRTFLFYRELKGIWAGTLDSPDFRQILPDNSPVVYSPEGWLIFVRNDALVAQAFDAGSLTLSGEPLPIITDQKNDPGLRRFSVSDTGVLLWQGQWQRDYQLIWHDREGKQIGTVDAPMKVGVGQDPHISPDGKRLAVKRDQNLWIIDLEKGTGQRITTTFAQHPVWSPDGTRIVASTTPGMAVINANGSGEPELLLSGPRFPREWTSDGRFILYVYRGVKSRLDMYALPLFGERKEMLLLESPFDEQQPQLSPDGKWLIYSTDDTGDYEIYVRSFSEDAKLGSEKVRLSTASGRSPVWRRDGRELFFVTSDGTLMSAEIKSGGANFQFSSPKPLFKTRMVGWFGNVHEYDVSPDGQRILIGTLVGDSKAPPPTVIMNWTKALKK